MQGCAWGTGGDGQYGADGALLSLDVKETGSSPGVDGQHGCDASESRPGEPPQSEAGFDRERGGEAMGNQMVSGYARLTDTTTRLRVGPEKPSNGSTRQQAT